MPDESGEMGSASWKTDEVSRELKRSQAVARIAGVNIPTKKRVEIALTYIPVSYTHLTLPTTPYV